MSYSHTRKAIYGKIKYNAESTDERALVDAAALLGGCERHQVSFPNPLHIGIHLCQEDDVRDCERQPRKDQDVLQRSR
ncbi:unnamed protein product [Acanthoscelides obtectus]|uniref:Uncharacterized protein n=1 Tax=Acanthoscelides obtectus TaxID=200917 RepID=A0A9P0VS17_ACAOB|nr:unnamed protein product [Acanthoscelides obtectus]CAK1682814.1 hypothetical protein AOBTE_LOCUS33907 [Acanthoscelides obtectus]